MFRVLLIAFLHTFKCDGMVYQFKNRQIVDSTWVYKSKISNVMSTTHCAILCFQTDDCTASRYYQTTMICEFGVRSVPVDANSLTPSGSVANIVAREGFMRLMIVAGTSSSGLTNNVDLVNFETFPTSCSTLPKYPLSVDGMSGIYFKGQPIVCGGFIPTPSPTYYDNCYMLTSGSWVSTFHLVKPIHHFGGIAMFQLASGDQSPLIAGGWNGAATQTTTQLFNTVSGWEQYSESLPSGMFCHCTCMINSTTAMVSGGTNNVYTLNTVYFLTDDGRGWIVGPPMKAVRQFHGCGKIPVELDSEKFVAIVLGGLDSDSRVEILDPEATQWRYGPSLPRTFTVVTLVADSRGGVILFNADTTNLYRLKHAGFMARWEILPQTTAQVISWTNSIFLVSDLVGNCTT